MNGNVAVCGISGSDTLLSSFLWSDPRIFDSLWNVESSDVSSEYYSTEAHSPLDLECRFYDTAVVDIGTPATPKLHTPMDIMVTQRSMAWTGASVDDFFILQYEVVNVGHKPLQQVYCTVFSGDYDFVGSETYEDDVTGFLQTYPLDPNCGNRDILNLAYKMDNDGDPEGGRFGTGSRRAGVGVLYLGSSQPSATIGYYWLIQLGGGYDYWGPRRKPTFDDPWRSFGPSFALPVSNGDYYYLMSHPHIAYDQLFAAVDHGSDGWMPPTENGTIAAEGLTPAVIYSFGPFDIPVREKISFTIAVVGGDNVHTNPNAYFEPTSPQSFYDQLDFSELATNAQWAKWVYDNPGVDTDSDGYFGEYRICEGETTWYKGDGVPDFRGNTPPPIPFTRYETEAGKIIVRWNGYLSETTKDIFSNLIDFEGYRVYCGLDNRKTSLALLTSYDKQDWLRWKYNELGSGESRWFNDDPPFSLDSLRILHNNPDLNPDDYPRQRPLFEGDSAFYFSAVDENVYSLTTPNGIHKAYPDAINPGTDSTLWTDADITTEHDGRKLPKYYEYEYVIDNLLPTVPYFVAVTVFDFGYAGGRGNMPPDETNPLNNVTECYAQTSSEIVEQENLDAYVYPNPYRVDAKYEDGGYENRKGNIIPDRARLIHFGNLPRVCKIKVYSLDGDHIGTIDHNFPEGGPESMHDWWNLVSRSGLAVESGLYYWVVESATRTQIGKLVILK